MNNLLPFQKPEPLPFPNLPGDQIWTSRDLARFLKVSESWVVKNTRATAKDPIPRIAMHKICFDTLDPDFQDWLKRHLRPVRVDRK